MYSATEDLFQKLLNDIFIMTEDFQDLTVIDEPTAVSHLLNKTEVVQILNDWKIHLTATCDELKDVKIDKNSLKSEEKALEYRILGNKAVSRNDYNNALQLYNKCIMYAKKSSENYLFGLSNRAVSLINIGNYKDAMKDLRIALSDNYPKDKMYKLYYRLAQCYYALGYYDEGILNCNYSIYELITNSDLPGKDIEALRLKINLMMKSPLVFNKPKEDRGELHKLLNEHHIEKGMSQKLKISETLHKGRTVTVSNHVNKDEIIFKEAAFVFLLIDGNDVRKCDYCFSSIKRQITLELCEMCSKNHYCDDTCRIAAWNRYHRWECYGERIGLWKTTGISQLSFRVFLAGSQAGFAIDNLSSCKSTKDIINMLNHEKINPCVYDRVYKLFTNMDQMDKTDLKTYTIVSILLMYYLRALGSYKDILPETLELNESQSEIDIFVASMLLRHTCQMICNSSVIMEANEPVASAIYPSISLMNHSCIPNTKISYNDKYAIVKAREEMKSSTEVLNCYGLQAEIHSIEDRQTTLQYQYGFKCECKACIRGQ